MLIGVPKEIKDNEFRVGMAPAGVNEVARHHKKNLQPCEHGNDSRTGLVRLLLDQNSVDIHRMSTKTKQA
ncbi:MAG: hypothetical protein RIA65_11950, partial [Woeseia sp.]